MSEISNSILTWVSKQILGSFDDSGTDGEEPFNYDLIAAINTALSILSNLGIGPEGGFVVTGYEETWDDFLGQRTDIEYIKSYVKMKTQLLFDPPQNSFLVDILTKQCTEFEYRGCMEADRTNPKNS